MLQFSRSPISHARAFDDRPDRLLLRLFMVCVSHSSVHYALFLCAGRAPNDGRQPVIDRTKGLASLGLDNAIRLRWVLRDIKSNRLKLSPASPEDINTLVKMGYVEMRDEKPMITESGTIEIEIGD